MLYGLIIELPHVSIYSHTTDEPNGSGFTVADSKTSHQDCSSVNVEVPIVVKDENEAVHESYTPERPTQLALLSVAQHRHTGGIDSTRQRKSAIAPVSSSRNSLPTMTEGYRPPLLLSEGRPPLPPSVKSGSANEDSSSVCTPSVESNVHGHAVSSPTEVSPTNSTGVLPVSSKPSCTGDYSRRPRLCSLRQMSIEESLPADMSEIELLTGDIHSPVLSKAPFKRQKVSFCDVLVGGG